MTTEARVRHCAVTGTEMIYSMWKMKVQDGMYFERVKDVCEMEASRRFMKC